MNDRTEKLIGVLATIPALVAGFFWMYTSQFSPETIAQVVATLGSILALAIPVYLHFLNDDRNKTFADFGYEALEKLSSENKDIMSGPEFFKDGYSPDDANVDKKYLFYKKAGTKRKASMIPLIPLKQGIIELSFPQMALDIIGISEPIDKVRSDTRSRIVAFASRKYANLHKELSPEDTASNICVVIDFSDRCAPKQFGKAVLEIGREFITALKSRKAK